MEKKNILEINKRDGKLNSNKLRAEHKVPGVIYGTGIEGGQPIYIEENLLNDILKHNTKTSVIPMKFDGKSGSVIVKEIVRNALTNFVEHYDLQAIDKNEVLTMEVSLSIVGEEEISHKKLLVNSNLTTLSVKGPADKVPESITVDVAELEKDDKIEAKDLKLPEGIELITPEDTLVISISEPTMAKEVDEEVAETEESENGEATEEEETKETTEE